MITTERLVKCFGKIKALDEVSIKVPDGINGLIGPNGAGKTTLINILSGLIKPDSGSVQILGFEPWSQRHKLMKKLGVLLEKYTFPSSVTGLRYIQHVARLKGYSDNEVLEALCHVELLKASERKILGYSAGMKKRLGVAAAILGNPELVILDEPTADLDPLGRIKLLRFVIRIHKEVGVNFLIASHILPELQKVCSWVCLMYEGKVVEQDFLETLLSKYYSKVYVVRVSNPEVFAQALRSRNLKVKIKRSYLYIKGDLSVIRHEVLNIAHQTGNEVISFFQPKRSLEGVFVRALKRGGIKLSC
ncbi:MAG: ABC transporter ATP-binding protein [Thermoproteota archaeon]